MRLERARQSFCQPDGAARLHHEAAKEKPVAEEAIARIAEDNGFPSRQAPKAAREPRRKRRVYTTGRNRQFNLKATAETVERFYKMADERKVPLCELMEQALDVLERAGVLRRAAVRKEESHAIGRRQGQSAAHGTRDLPSSGGGGVRLDARAVKAIFPPPTVCISCHERTTQEALQVRATVCQHQHQRLRVTTAGCVRHDAYRIVPVKIFAGTATTYRERPGRPEDAEAARNDPNGLTMA